ncbi:MAG: hypothetical protein WC852_03780 [Candidatus Nanoarchaeia archaeon]|jgi:hypothetical protein
MAPEKSPKDPYFSRLNALYQNLDEILHPMLEITVKKLPEDKFVISPDFALPVGKRTAGNTISRPKGCIYFEKLNETEHKAVSEALTQYARGQDNFSLLPPRICKKEKNCQGHHFLEDMVTNKLPENLSFCFIYFFS